VLFDQFINEQVQQGADMVVNLAAGLDARPYRMALPAALQWVEVDLPDLIAYKEDVLRAEKPVCALERIRLDLADVGARRSLFEQLGQRAKKALIITEGLLIYLSAEEVGALAQDLSAPGGFQRWVIDLASPGLLAMMQKQMGTELNKAGAPFKFGPAEGPDFFTPFGWKPIDVRGMLKTAARLKRLKLWMRLLALLPESKGKQGKRPWSGICLLAKTPLAA
jgi:methyltransferase (TIGR00027 family)